MHVVHMKKEELSFMIILSSYSTENLKEFSSSLINIIHKGNVSGSGDESRNDGAMIVVPAPTKHLRDL